MGAKRKNSNKNVTRKKYRRWFLPLLLVIVLASGWYIAEWHSDDVLPIERVEIAGMFVNLSQDEIRQQVAQALEGGYFTLNLDTVRTSLLALPWVEDASVRRLWPSVLKIEVIEKQAVAYWADDALLSSRGELFRPGKIDRSMNLPVLSGPEGLHHKVWSFLVLLHEQLSAVGLGVEKLALDDRRSWSMFLSNGIELRLGRIDTSKRINRFVKVFSMKNAPDINNADYIDLRYPNGFAMRIKQQVEGEAMSDEKISGGDIHA